MVPTYLIFEQNRPDLDTKCFPECRDYSQDYGSIYREKNSVPNDLYPD